MGLITGLLTVPLAPVRGTMWVAERLLEAEARYERGEISADEFERLEDELLRRLTAKGDW